MAHLTPLISIIALGFILSYFLSMLCIRWKLSPLLGYLVAGILLGPNVTFFYNADIEIANELAEIGVMLLLFGVGLHFSIKDLQAVKNISVPGSIIQVISTTLVATLVGLLIGYGWFEAVIFGLCLSVASTVVLLRQLEDHRLTTTPRGKIAIGWLIMQDVITILVLVILPTLTFMVSNQPFELKSFGWSMLITLLKVATFVAIMYYRGTVFIPRLVQKAAGTGSNEIFLLAVLSISIGIAYLAVVFFNVSYALGAFFAGMILNGTELSHRAERITQSLRDFFGVLFFVSVGMLFDYHIIFTEFWKVLATTLIILVATPTIAYIIVRVLGKSPRAALTIGISLGQIGEFSFILAGLAVGFGYISTEARDLVLSGAIITIILNPLVFQALEKFLKYYDMKQQAALAHLQDVEFGEAGLATVSSPESSALNSTPTPTAKVNLGYTSVSTAKANLGSTLTSSLTSSQTSTQISTSTEASVITQDSEHVVSQVEQVEGRSATPGSFTESSLGVEHGKTLEESSEREASHGIESGVMGTGQREQVGVSSTADIQELIPESDYHVLAETQPEFISSEIEAELPQIQHQADLEAQQSQTSQILADLQSVAPEEFAGTANLVPLSEEELEHALEYNYEIRSFSGMSNHHLVIGYGVLGKLLVSQLLSSLKQVVVITNDYDQLVELNQAGIHFLYGDFHDLEIFQHANLKDAETLSFTTTRDVDSVAQICHQLIEIYGKLPALTLEPELKEPSSATNTVATANLATANRAETVTEDHPANHTNNPQADNSVDSTTATANTSGEITPELATENVVEQVSEQVPEQESKPTRKFKILAVAQDLNENKYLLNNGVDVIINLREISAAVMFQEIQTLSK